MILKKEDIVRLRKEIEKKVKDIPEGKRIHLDKDLLNTLLFDMDSEKILEWNCPYFSKIDLSEIDFGDVSFKGSIDLSNTNIKIDFTKIDRDVAFVNFENVDLSNSNINDSKIHFFNCRLNNTGITLNNDTLSRISCCDLSNTDLSNCEIYFCYLDMNNYSYTGINILFPLINVSEEQIKEYNNMCQQSENDNYAILSLKQHSYNWPFVIYSNNYHGAKERLEEKIKSGDLKECYINGRKLKSKEELAEIRKCIDVEAILRERAEKEELYQNDLKNIESDLFASIESQKKDMGINNISSDIEESVLENEIKQNNEVEGQTRLLISDEVSNSKSQKVLCKFLKKLINNK